MLRFISLLCVVCANVFVDSTIAKSSCNGKCTPVQDCQLVRHMSRDEQTQWFAQYSCDTPHSDDGDITVPYGFAPLAKGDLICCPKEKHRSLRESSESRIVFEDTPREDENNYDTNVERNDNREADDALISHKIKGTNQNKHRFNFNDRPSYPKQSNYNNQNSYGRNYNSKTKPTSYDDQNQYGPTNGNSWNRDSNRQNNNQNPYSSEYNNDDRRSDYSNYDGQMPFYNNGRRNQNDYSNNRRSGNLKITTDNPYFYPKNQNPRNSNFGPNQNQQNSNFGRNQNSNFGPNQNQQTSNFGRNQNSNFGPNQNQQGSNFGPNQNSNIGSNQGQQISNIGRNGDQCTTLSSFPPDPNSGCCGIDSSDADRVTGPSIYNSNIRSPSQGYRSMPNSFLGRMFSNLFNFAQPASITKRAADTNDTKITIDTRIIGGKETEINQFPWTVLLKTIFIYGTKEQAFNCGGSLISSRYVLTAAHCVAEEGARVSSVEITLAEYDKRTFPNDCVAGYEGRQCVKNIITYAEDIIPHREYDDTRLQNDIALLRLRNPAPYTEFIRPICLPIIDIDSPDFTDIPLSVAGWGRNGRYNSNVKQSTTVNLVPQRECKRSYSQLTRRHLCAAGYTGEDTCKGDSGGPLMILYEGKYFVSGIVSGKRADSPCGTSVPSLYTNVYQYRDWIMNNMRN